VSSNRVRVLEPSRREPDNAGTRGAWRLVHQDLLGAGFLALGVGLLSLALVTVTLAVLPLESRALHAPALVRPVGVHVFLIALVVGAGSLVGESLRARFDVGRPLVLLACFAGLAVWITVSGFQTAYVREFSARHCFFSSYEALYEAARRWRLDGSLGPLIAVAFPPALVAAVPPLDPRLRPARAIGVVGVSLLVCLALYYGSGAHGEALHALEFIPGVQLSDDYYESWIVWPAFLRWVTPGASFGLSAAIALAAVHRRNAPRVLTEGSPSTPLKSVGCEADEEV